MAIRKGEAWEFEGHLPPDAPVVGTDEAAALQVAQAGPSHGPVKLAIMGGDIARTLGLGPNHDPFGGSYLVPLDVLQIELDDGKARVAAAHVLIGHPLRDSHVVALMNAAFIGKRNVAPRSHPGDGKAEVVTFRLSAVDRFKALRRMTTGAHVPHPDIKIRQRSEGRIDVDRRRPVWVDGRRVGASQSVEFRVLSEAIVAAV